MGRRSRWRGGSYATCGVGSVDLAYDPVLTGHWGSSISSQELVMRMQCEEREDEEERLRSERRTAGPAKVRYPADPRHMWGSGYSLHELRMQL